MITAEAFATAAEALVGARFRLHGRNPVSGVDCVGVIACAFAGAGGKPQPPSGYSLRNTAIDHFLALAGANGFVAACGTIRRGDLLLVAPGPGQHHLLCAVGEDAVVHAHAGLGRVVCQPLGESWPILHHWRLAQPKDTD